ncbi:MAG: ATP-binding protein [Lachnospiraceae bacterium]
MYRIIMNDLMEWYEKAQDKVLFLKGAKGVGKTWTMIDFGQGFYKQLIYVDLERDDDSYPLFKQGAKVKAEKLIAALAMYCNQKIVEGDTLFVFDEPQHYPKAVEAIMSLKKQCPDLPVCIIASTVGNIVHEAEYAEKFYNLILYPMTFEEFLTANKAQDLCKHIENQKIEPVAPEIIEKITEYLKLYYIVGGMPIVVLDYVKNKDLNRVDAILKALLIRTKEYIDREVPKSYAVKVDKIWNSIPAQMEKDNRKFMYQYVDEKARAREYENSVNWLVDTGLVRKVNRIKEGIAPLALQIDDKSFELYHLDHGLLRVMCGISHKQINVDEDLEDVNGALLEQLVLSELTMNKTVDKLYFWISGATARVDFVFEDDGEVVPVDVQSRIRRKAQSMKVFNAKYKNHMAIRISLDELGFSKGILNIPLYGLWNF